MALTVAAPSTAFAATALPYRFTVDFISGGDSGVRTPTLITNSTGRVCITPNLSERTPANSVPDYEYATRLFDENSEVRLGTFFWDIRSDNTKACYTTVGASRQVYVRIQKSVFRSGQTFNGGGVISAS